MYEITYSEDDSVLFYKVSGFWSMDLLRKFQEELIARISKARVHDPNFKILSDSIDFSVQSTEVAEEMKTMMTVGVKITSGRKAFVVGSALLKAQYRRTIGHPTVEFFFTMKEARDWLKADA